MVAAQVRIVTRSRRDYTDGVAPPRGWNLRRLLKKQKSKLGTQTDNFRPGVPVTRVGKREGEHPVSRPATRIDGSALAACVLFLYNAIVITAARVPPLTSVLAEQVEALYARLSAQISALGVGCWVRGECCNFDRAPHTLYASTLELGYLKTKRPTVGNETFDPDSPLCPFWRDGKCTEREGRPLGCRSFFCDARFRTTLESLYETHHRELQSLAEAHEYPWEYLPFVASLRKTDPDSVR